MPLIYSPAHPSKLKISSYVNNKTETVRSEKYRLDVSASVALDSLCQMYAAEHHTIDHIKQLISSDDLLESSASATLWHASRLVSTPISIITLLTLTLPQRLQYFMTIFMQCMCDSSNLAVIFYKQLLPRLYISWEHTPLFHIDRIPKLGKIALLLPSR